MANRLRQSTSFRLSRILVCIYATAYVLTGFFLWIDNYYRATEQSNEAVIAEMSALELRFATSPPDTAAARLQTRAQENETFIYRLTNPDGKIVIEGHPDLHGEDGVRTLPLKIDKNNDKWRVTTKLLPSGYTLSVGTNFSELLNRQNELLRSLGLIAGILGVIAFYVGLIISRQVLAKIEEIRTTLSRAKMGDLSARYQETSPDPSSDIDEIGYGVNAALEQIEKLVGSIRRVSRDVAHDLRTPLTQLRNNLEKTKHANTKAERAALIEASELKLESILHSFDAILRMSEIESGQIKRNFQQVNLTAIAEKAANAYGPDIEEKGHRIHAKCDRHTWVIGDEALLFQAVANLIENAAKHTPPGTKILLETRAGSGGSTLIVSDNGAGVAETDRAAILEPFQRLDTSRSTSGSGLGLSIVAAIAKIHKAEIRLEDNQPGLRIVLYFPHPI